MKSRPLRRRSQGRVVTTVSATRDGRGVTGFTDQPTYEDATAIGEDLLERFLQRTEEGGADEIHIVYTHFVNMGVQEPECADAAARGCRRGRRLQPTGGDAVFPLYEFEPEP